MKIARPGLIQSSWMPLGKSLGSGGGFTLCTMSQFTSALRSAPIITIRQGVVMGPLTTAGRVTRSMSWGCREPKAKIIGAAWARRACSTWAASDWNIMPL